MKSWDQRYFAIAREVASWSKDRSTKVGAVIIGAHGEIASTGFNGFPRGVNEDQQRTAFREEKYRFTVHAELNAILNAARLGVSCLGLTMYTLEPPCHECAKAIVQAGIVRIKIPMLTHNYTWNDPMHVSLGTALTILGEAGVVLKENADV